MLVYSVVVNITGNKKLEYCEFIRLNLGEVFLKENPLLYATLWLHTNLVTLLLLTGTILILSSVTSV